MVKPERGESSQTSPKPPQSSPVRSWPGFIFPKHSEFTSAVLHLAGDTSFPCIPCDHSSLLNLAAGSQAEPNKSTWPSLHGGFGLRAGSGEGIAAETGVGSQRWGLSRAFLGAAKAGGACPDRDVSTISESWVMLFPQGGQTKMLQKHQPKTTPSLTFLPIPVPRIEVAASPG